MEQASYTALGVPALKALCKARGISGYSKLSKQALINKLCSGGCPQAATVPSPEQLGPNSQSAPDGQPPSDGHGRAPEKRKIHDARPAQESKKLKADSQALEAAQWLPTIESQRPLRSPSSNVPPSTTMALLMNATVNDEPANSGSQDSPSKGQIDPPQSVPEWQTSQAGMKTTTLQLHPRQPALFDGSQSGQGHAFNAAHAKSVPVRDQTRDSHPGPASKPFIKVVPQKKKSIQHNISCEIDGPRPESSHASSHPDVPTNLTPPEPRNIAYPPRLSHRSQTARLSIILSQLHDSSRNACLFVSKRWRYAIYLSAQTILRRFYSGARLDAYLHNYRHSLLQLDFWPYLRYRQREKELRQRAYRDTFLHALFGMNPISKHLWCAPDDENQTIAALRFLTARTWLAVNIGDQRAVRWAKSVVTDAQPASRALSSSAEDSTGLNDIWKITVSCESPLGTASPEIYWIIAETGEVIGHAPDSPFIGAPDSPVSHSLRLDWCNFLNSGDPTRILDRVRWSNAEDYEHGISRHWLKKWNHKNATNQHLIEKQMAERYVLASVAGNSLSGRYQTAIEMAQEFSGSGSPVSPINTKKPVPSLYIPEHHYVESVHFTTSHGLPLHPALAVIQTPMRECYVLRDTGSEVGTEEEGVKLVWQEVLGCSPNGVPI